MRRSRPAPKSLVIQALPLTSGERLRQRERERALRGRAYRGLPIFRPEARSGCRNVPRPCPFVSCSLNNYLEVTRTGAIKLTFPHLAPGEMDPELSCAHDIQDQGGVSLDVVGRALNVSMSRAGQIVEDLLGKGRAVFESIDADLLPALPTRRP